MALDTSLPLQVQQPNMDLGATLGKAFTLKNAMQNEQIGKMQIEEMQRKTQSQKALSAALADPNSWDSDGGLKPQTMSELYKSGADFNQVNTLQRTQINNKAKQADLETKFLKEAAPEMVANYQKYQELSKTLGPEAAWQTMLPQLKVRSAELKASHPWAPIDPNKITPESLKAAAMHSETFMKQTLDKDKPITPYEQAQLNQPKSNLGKLEADFKAGRIAEKDYKEAKAKMDAPTSTQISLTGQGTLSKDALTLAVDQYMAGDHTAAQGYARNAAMKAQFQNRLAERAKELGMGGKDIAASVAEFQGTKAGERTLGTRTANIEMAVTEASKMADLALDASEGLKRSGVKSLNTAIQAVEEGTANPELRKFVAANTSFINAYARAISPSGVPTVSDKDHARDMLDTAFSKGDYKATISQLQAEMKAAQESPGEVRGRMRRDVTGKEDSKPKSNAKASDFFNNK